MVGNAVVNIDSNVQIRTIDRNGKILRTTYKHNKATVNLVDGILRFLKGDFSATDYNKTTTPDEAIIYIPVRAQFGRIGVKLKESPNPQDRRFDYIDKDEFATPTFDSAELQEPITFDDPVVENSLLRFKRISQVGYTDNNNAECLEMSLYINPGKLVGQSQEITQNGKKVVQFIPYDWSYYNPSTGEYEAMLTEVGLLSSSDVLLARVLLDGDVVSEEYYDSSAQSQGNYPAFVDPSSEDNPIIQSESTTVVLVWRIGIVSVGKNDEFVTQTNLSNQQFSRQLAEWLTEKEGGYIEQVTGIDPDDWNKGFSPTRVRKDIQAKVSELLNGVSVSDLSNQNEEGSGS